MISSDLAFINRKKVLQKKKSFLTLAEETGRAEDGLRKRKGRYQTDEHSRHSNRGQGPETEIMDQFWSKVVIVIA
jgi:hypothetical protein